MQSNARAAAPGRRVPLKPQSAALVHFAPKSLPPRSPIFTECCNRRLSAMNPSYSDHKLRERTIVRVSASGDSSPQRGGSNSGNTGSGSSMPSASELEASASLRPVLTCVAVACLGAFSFGYHLGVLNGPLEAIAADLGFAGNKSLQGFVVSSALAGAAAGSLSGGGISDALGRRTSFFLACAPLLLGAVVSAKATSFNGIVVGRLLIGVAIGLTSALVPTYISEVSPTKIRGTLGSLNQLMICVGILAALVVNVALPVTEWRTMMSLAAVPAAALAVGMAFCPESPRWLASNGMMASAEAAARKLWGPAGPAQLDVAPASSSAAGGAAGGAAPSEGWAELLGPRYRRAVFIGCMLFVFQQFAGINALVYFSTSVFRQAGIQSDTLASAAVGATNVLGTLIATGLMDRAGRKQLLYNSFIGQGVAMLVMAAGFGLPALSGAAGGIAVVGTLAYILSFALGAGPVPGLMVPELNAARIRGRAAAAAFGTHWVCNLVVGQGFLAAVDAYGLSVVYAAFGAVALAGAAFVARRVPETKGKTLEQIEAELAAVTGDYGGSGLDSGGGGGGGLKA